MGFYSKRSKLSNWKVKEIIQKDGHMYYTIWFKSIFGFWRSLRKSSEYPDEWSKRCTFQSKEEAKKRVKKEIMQNVAMDRTKIQEIKEIKFD